MSQVSVSCLLHYKLLMNLGIDLDTMGAHRALCTRCVRSRLFFTTGSHGSQGPEIRTPQPLLVHQGFSFLV